MSHLPSCRVRRDHSRPWTLLSANLPYRRQIIAPALNECRYHDLQDREALRCPAEQEHASQTHDLPIDRN